MRTPLETFDICVAAGETPSGELMKAVVQQCLSDRNIYKRTAEDLEYWMSSLVTAHLFKDHDALKDIMDEFIRARVKMQSDQTTSLH